MGTTSLDYNRRSLAPVWEALREIPPCASGSLVLRSDATGAWAPMPCQRNRCPVCGARRALATAIAVGMAKPDRFITLTLVGDDPKQIRSRLSDWKRRLREAGHEGEFWGAIEANPRGTGHHFHCWWRGPYIPQATISDVARRCGMGSVTWVEAYRGGVEGVFYGTKTITGAGRYGLKVALDGGLQEFLDLHRGRFGVWSRGFFGMPFREAIQAALKRPEREGHDPGPWRVRSLVDMYRFDKAREAV